jgi:LPS O-antigen subunit length determinant protein (WzzB/FepE family)
MNGMWGINGLTGYFIAVVLLLSIAFGLGYGAITTQQYTATHPYAIRGNTVPEPKTVEDVYANLHELKMDSTENQKYAISKN